MTTILDPARELANLVPAEALTRWSAPHEPNVLHDTPVVAPGDADEWTGVMNAARAASWSCLVVGNGSRLGWCNAPERVDLVLSTRRSVGVLAYEPGDGTLTARAGTSVAELQRIAATGGHHLTPDVPRPGGSTLGGVLASGCNGFDRLRYGPARHNVLGMRVLLANGSIAKAGGRLVKNVTGYDLHRLYTGSHGTLCVVLEASLRLYPLPDVRAAVAMEFPTRRDAIAAAARISSEAVRPAAVVVRDTALFVFHVGRRSVVDWELECVRTHAASKPNILTGDDERALREEMRDFEPSGAPCAELSTRPSRIEAALVRFETLANELGITHRSVVHPGLATALVRIDAADDEQLIRLRCEEFEARVHWRNLPARVATEGDVFGPSPVALPMMRELKRALDPTGVFCAGRFHAGL